MSKSELNTKPKTTFINLLFKNRRDMYEQNNNPQNPNYPQQPNPTPDANAQYTYPGYTYPGYVVPSDGYFSNEPMHTIPQTENPIISQASSQNPNQDIAETPSTTESKDVNIKNNETKPKGKPFLTAVGDFFKTLIFLIIITALAISSLLVYILIRPDGNLSKWLNANTPLGQYLGINKEGDSSSSSSSSSSMILNSVLGLDKNTEKSFEFAKPTDSKTTTEIVRNSLPSVLSISLKTPGSKFGSTELVSGTGIVVSSDGLVITNKHVIAKKCQDTNGDIQVSALTQDQKVYDLKLLSVDPVDDIAILQINNAPAGTTFTPVKFADTTNTQLGTEVLAIGNALGQLQNTVTRGIVSGLNRSIDDASNVESLVDECTNQKIPFIDGLIQTDAAINPGNSGGPLFDSTGLMIGMNTLGTKDAQSIGLAISSNTIVKDLNSFKTEGKIVRARLGLLSKNITPLQKEQNKWLPVDYGEIILSPNASTKAVAVDGPADQAKLREGDIILEVNGTKIVADSTNPSPLRRIILSKLPNETISLTVLKVKSETATGYEYEPTSQKINVKLGGISFDLPKSK